MLTYSCTNLRLRHKIQDCYTDLWCGGRETTLSVLAIPHKSSEKTGPQIGKATKEHPDAWGCSGSTTGMVFDTTSSNTGAISTGCIPIQKDSVNKEFARRDYTLSSFTILRDHGQELYMRLVGCRKFSMQSR